MALTIAGTAPSSWSAPSVSAAPAPAWPGGEPPSSARSVEAADPGPVRRPDDASASRTGDRGEPGSSFASAETSTLIAPSDPMRPSAVSAAALTSPTPTPLGGGGRPG
jgi:hypothetical protein